MNLPITPKELESIIQLLKGPNPKLYAKLWSYKINCLNKEKTNGLS